MERAQRDADKVFYWVRLHGNAQPRPPVTSGGAAGTVTKPAVAAAASPAAATPGVVPKRPAPVTRTAAATVAEPASTGTAAANRVPAAATGNLAIPETAPETTPETAPETAPETPTEGIPAAVPEAPEPTPAAAAPETVEAKPGPPAEAAPEALSKPPAESAGAEHAGSTLVAINPLTTPTITTEPTPLAMAEERLRPIEQPAPEFPAALVQTLRRGSVRVQFNVLSDGRVAQAEIVSTSHTRLIPAALAAIQQWRFQPVARTQAAQVDLAFNID